MRVIFMMAISMRVSKFLLTAAILLYLAGCSVSSGILSEDERRSIYSLSFSAPTSSLENGSQALPGDRIIVTISPLKGAAEPARLDLELFGANGAVIAAVSYSTEISAKSIAFVTKPAPSVVVARLSGDLPGFALPADLAPGSYRLVSTIDDLEGNALQKSELLFFVGPPGFALGSVSVSPPNPAPGTPALLIAAIGDLPVKKIMPSASAKSIVGVKSSSSSAKSSATAASTTSGATVTTSNAATATTNTTKSATLSSAVTEANTTATATSVPIASAATATTSVASPSAFSTSTQGAASASTATAPATAQALGAATSGAANTASPAAASGVATTSATATIPVASSASVDQASSVSAQPALASSSNASSVSISASSANLDAGLAAPVVAAISSPLVGEEKTVILNSAATDSALFVDEVVDPWLKWSFEGKVFAEGPLSSSLNRVVWPAPSADGVYEVTVDLYPAPPPTGGYTISSPWNQQVQILVKSPPAGTFDEYGDKARFISFFPLEGDFADVGTRSRDTEPLSFGSPELDAYPGGFGYRLGVDTGFLAKGVILPSSDSKATPFSILARVYTEQDSGDIVKMTASDGTTALRLGLIAGQPFLEIGSGSNVARSRVGKAVGPGQTDLMVSLVPVSEGYRVYWTIAGERFASPALPPVLIAGAANLKVGGTGAVTGIYDAIAISDDGAQGPPLAYYASLKRRHGLDLVMAEGFESLDDVKNLNTRGSVSYSRYDVELSPAAELAYAKGLRFEKPILFEARYTGVRPTLRVDYLPESDPVRFFIVDDEGQVITETGTILGRLDLEAGLAAFILRPSGEGIEISASTGSILVSIPFKFSPDARSLRFSLMNLDSQLMSSVYSLSIRSSVELYGSTARKRIALLF